MSGHIISLFRIYYSAFTPAYSHLPAVLKTYGINPSRCLSSAALFGRGGKDECVRTRGEQFGELGAGAL